MKKLLLALFIFISIGWLSCEKSQDGPGEIHGTWKLVEQYNDPGDGSGRYVEVKGEPQFLTLDQEGNIKGNAMPNLLSYKILDSVQMEVVDKAYQNPMIYRYRVTSAELYLSPRCIEGCGYKFKRQ